LIGGTPVYERLAEDAARWLRDGGLLAVEIGSGQGDAVVEVLRRSFTDVRVEPDLAGRDRVATGRRP